MEEALKFNMSYEEWDPDLGVYPRDQNTAPDREPHQIKIMKKNI